jgi:hypothetical protein
MAPSWRWWIPLTLLYADEMAKTPSSWSPDGRYLLYTADSPKALSDI